MKWFERFATAVSLTTLVACAHGQTPPAQEPDEEETEPKLLWNRFEIEIPGWSFRGNRNKFRQYATPPQGFVIRNLEMISPVTDEGRFFRLGIRGFPDQDMAGEGRFIGDGGRLDVKVSHTTHRFSDPTPLVIDSSQDRRTQVGVSYSLTPKIGAFFQFRESDRNLSFDPPKDRTDTRTKYAAAGVEGAVLGGHAEFTVADNRVYDATGVAPDSVRHRVDARFGRDFGESFGVQGAFSRTQIEQRGLQDSEVESWNVGANWYVGPSTTLLFDMRNDELEMPNVLNAVVRERFF